MGSLIERENGALYFSWEVVEYVDVMLFWGILEGVAQKKITARLDRFFRAFTWV